MSSESELNKLKVPELKAKLTELGLSTVGRKEELIARILTATTAEAAAPTGDDFDPLLAPPQEFNWEDGDSAAPAAPELAAPIAPATSTPSLDTLDKKLEKAPAVAEASTSSAAPADAPAPPAPTPAEPAPTPAAPPAPVLSAEEKAAAAAADIEKKKARAARFGVPYVEKAEPTPPRKATATLPPTASKAAAKAKTAVPTKPTTAAAAAVPVVAAPKKELDPVEEEKKRKRAEKFGPVAVPAEKKTKTD